MLGSGLAALAGLFWAQYMAFGDCDGPYRRTDDYERFCDGDAGGLTAAAVIVAMALLVACCVFVPWALAAVRRIRVSTAVGTQLVIGAVAVTVPFVIKAALQDTSLTSELPLIPVATAASVGVVLIVATRRGS